MDSDETVETPVHIELSETDTESFEDLGPRVALANGGVVQPVVQPIVRNITPIKESVTETTSGVVLRRSIDSSASDRLVFKSLYKQKVFKITINSNFISPHRQLLPDGLDASKVAHHVWSAGKDKAQRWAKIYGNLDNLRPYFDVDPRTVANRVLQSFIPVTDLSTPEKGKKIKTILSSNLFL